MAATCRFAHFGSLAVLFRAIQPVCCHLHSILFECNACGGNVGLPADCRARLILCKGSTNRCNFKMFSSNNRFEPLPDCGSCRVVVWRHGHGKQAIMMKYAYRGPVLLVSMPFCIAKRPFSPAKTCRSACPHGPFCNLFPVVLQSVEGQLVAETGKGGKRILHRCSVARPMVAWRVWRLAVVPSLFRERLPVCGYVLSALPPCHVLALASASCTSFLVLPLLKMAKHLVDAIKCCIFA